jgi:hypothetical protein
VTTLVTKTVQENSVGVHTHLSPFLVSQSPVDAQRGKEEGKEGQWPPFAAMRQKWLRRPERTAQGHVYIFTFLHSYISLC